MKAGSSPVDKLGNILPRVLRRQPRGQELIGTTIAAAFRMVIGAEPAGLCDEIELHSGTLVVTTSSPALAHQLRLDSELILSRLKDLNLGRKVRSIGVRIVNSPPEQGAFGSGSISAWRPRSEAAPSGWSPERAPERPPSSRSAIGDWSRGACRPLRSWS